MSDESVDDGDVINYRSIIVDPEDGQALALRFDGRVDKITASEIIVRDACEG